MSFIVDIGRCSERGQRSLNGDFAGAVQVPPAEAWRGLVAAVADACRLAARAWRPSNPR